MIFQWLSMVYLCFIVFLFVIMSFGAGLNAANMPTIGQKLLQTPTSVIGQVLFNFTLANTVPSWVNTKHPKVSIHKCVWTAIGISCGMYCFTGLFAALAFDVPEGSDLFAAMTLRFKGTSWANLLNFITFTWPIMVLLTSIPVSIIIVKLNLITSRICSKDWANFYGTILPFIVAIPFQTGNYLIVFSNWTSIIFQSLCNFVAPFLIYIFLEKRNLVLQQSVLDELENLDLDGGIKKRSYADDDDFDYVYHLPHADLTRIGPRKYDPFAKFAKIEDAKKPNFGEVKVTSPTSNNNNNIPGVPVPVISTDSSSSLRARRGIGRILDMGGESGQDKMKRLHMHHNNSQHMNGSHMGLGGLGVPSSGSRRGSFISTAGGMGVNGSMMSFGQGGGAPGIGIQVPTMGGAGLGGGGGGLGAAGLGAPGLGGENGGSAFFNRSRRASFSPSATNSNKVHPESIHAFNQSRKMSYTGTQTGTDRNSQSGSQIYGGYSYMDETATYTDNGQDIDDGRPRFKALPDWVTNRISSKTVAIICFLFMFGLALSVIIYNFVQLGQGTST
ncbi:hypothetical protein HDV05_004605 [Chytridiales sp. JEL 0842]|nr:hypothetical protein HDV05_004605 [Chytridiales sp. JEL 0842]